MSFFPPYSDSMAVVRMDGLRDVYWKPRIFISFDKLFIIRKKEIKRKSGFPTQESQF